MPDAGERDAETAPVVCSRAPQPNEGTHVTVSPEIKTAIDEFGATLKKIREKQEEFDRALKNGRGDPLVRAELDRMHDDLNALHKKANRPRIASAGGDSPSVLERKADEEFGRWLGKADGAGAGRSRDAYGKVFSRYLRVDSKGALTPDEMKTLSVGSSPDGGFFVEPARATSMIDKIYETSDLRQAGAQVVTISSKSYITPIDRDEPTTGWVGEQSSRPQTNTPQLGELEIPVHELYAMPAATQNLLDDAGINVDAWLEQKVSDQMGREENAAFVNGNGVKQPKGFTTYATAATADASRAFGTLEHILTGSNGAFKTGSASVNPADDLLALIYRFKSGYRKNLRWAGTRVTLGQIRTFKDQNGNYVYTPLTSANGIIDTVFGYPWDEFADMADYSTTGALGVALADWKRGYCIVDRLGIRVLRDPFTSKPYVLFYTTKRVGGGVLDSDAIKFLKFAAP
jgi:HK97 family phage major capsid protein